MNRPPSRLLRKTPMRKISSRELARCNGRNGLPVYIAYNGKVYDVSESFLWKEGRHQVLHDAGQDLTEALSQAPHGAEILDRFLLVGELQGN
jgi:predicted heme/steroid binding protein